MTKLQMLKKEAQSLSVRDLAKLRAFLAELDEAMWDAEIEADSRSGALDSLIAEARAEDAKGETSPL